MHLLEARILDKNQVIAELAQHAGSLERENLAQKQVIAELQAIIAKGASPLSHSPTLRKHGVDEYVTGPERSMADIISNEVDMQNHREKGTMYHHSPSHHEGFSGARPGTGTGTGTRPLTGARPGTGAGTRAGAGAGLWDETDKEKIARLEAEVVHLHEQNMQLKTTIKTLLD
jgi:hypothetical protein